MTDLNALYQAALKNQEATKDAYGVSRQTLSNGDVLICMVDRVAGRSVVKKHYRTTFGLKLAAAEYAKPISRAKAARLS